VNVNAFHLPPALSHMGESHGVKVAISTDTHSPAGLGFTRFGVDQARRGWLAATDVINTRSLAELRKFIKR
jgi:DNA polymerase (family X)